MRIPFCGPAGARNAFFRSRARGQWCFAIRKTNASHIFQLRDLVVALTARRLWHGALYTAFAVDACTVWDTNP